MKGWRCNRVQNVCQIYSENGFFENIEYILKCKHRADYDSFYLFITDKCIPLNKLISPALAECFCFNVFTSVSAHFRLIVRPRERKADTEETECYIILFSGRILVFFHIPGVKHWYIGPRFKVSSERLVRWGIKLTTPGNCSSALPLDHGPPVFSCNISGRTIDP